MTRATSGGTHAVYTLATPGVTGARRRARGRWRRWPGFPNIWRPRFGADPSGYVARCSELIIRCARAQRGTGVQDHDLGPRQAPYSLSELGAFVPAGWRKPSLAGDGDRPQLRSIRGIDEVSPGSASKCRRRDCGQGGRDRANQRNSPSRLMTREVAGIVKSCQSVSGANGLPAGITTRRRSGPGLSPARREALPRGPRAGRGQRGPKTGRSRVLADYMAGYSKRSRTTRRNGCIGRASGVRYADPARSRCRCWMDGGAGIVRELHSRETRNGGALLERETSQRVARTTQMIRAGGTAWIWTRRRPAIRSELHRLIQRDSAPLSGETVRALARRRRPGPSLSRCGRGRAAPARPALPPPLSVAGEAGRAIKRARQARHWRGVRAVRGAGVRGRGER